jgi:hypothetical protein
MASVVTRRTHASLDSRERNVFGQAAYMKIEKNVATIERDEEHYHIVVTVEHRGADAITPDQAELVLTKVVPFLFTQRIRFGG